jgi:hypothetical protein
MHGINVCVSDAILDTVTLVQAFEVGGLCKIIVNVCTHTYMDTLPLGQACNMASRAHIRIS